MESLSRYLSASPPFLNPSKTFKSNPKSHIFLSKFIPISNSKLVFSKPNKSHLPLLLLPFNFPTLPSLAAELTNLPTEQQQEVSTRINLESILVSIDSFFTRYPFFVASVAFIWLVAIPVTEYYLQKYKFVSAIDAFTKLRDDPNCQLLDIRDSKSAAYLSSPNLKRLNKSSLQIEFREDEDEDGFVKRVMESFGEPSDTSVCVIDNFDGNSMRVAELLVKNGFKEAYAIEGGIRGKKGWQEIQENLLPLYVHVYPTKKAKMSKQLDTNGGIKIDVTNNNGSPSTTSSSANTGSQESNDEHLSSISPTVQSKGGQRPSSPYINYPDLKPPSSPTPSKPN